MADKETRVEAADETKRNGIEAAAPPAMSVAEAGRKGGRATARRRGPDFYRDIGRKGGVATSEAHGPNFYSEIGRKGGEARAADPDVRSGALGRKGALARWGSGDAARDAPDHDGDGEESSRPHARSVADHEPDRRPSK